MRSTKQRSGILTAWMIILILYNLVQVGQWSFSAIATHSYAGPQVHAQVFDESIDEERQAKERTQAAVSWIMSRSIGQVAFRLAVIASVACLFFGSDGLFGVYVDRALWHFFGISGVTRFGRLYLILRALVCWWESFIWQNPSPGANWSDLSFV